MLHLFEVTMQELREWVPVWSKRYSPLRNLVPGTTSDERLIWAVDGGGDARIIAARVQPNITSLELICPTREPNPQAQKMYETLMRIVGESWSELELKEYPAQEMDRMAEQTVLPIESKINSLILQELYDLGDKGIQPELEIAIRHYEAEHKALESRVELHKRYRAELFSESVEEITPVSPGSDASQPEECSQEQQEEQRTPAKKVRGSNEGTVDRCRAGLEEYLDTGRSLRAAAELAGVHKDTLLNNIPHVLASVEEDTRKRWTTQITQKGKQKYLNRD